MLSGSSASTRPAFRTRSPTRGSCTNLDVARVNADLATVCAAQIRFFASARERKAGGGAPFDRYLFLTNVVTDGYGGLEHRASTALICSRDSLPIEGAKERSRGYRTFLGLASHEYFHSWNVKRIKPALFAPYDLDRETHTELLWIFEGFTSYYDDLFLVRTGLIDETQYLEEIATTIDQVVNALGSARQSVADSSFDAWTKYYRADENTPNAVASYYKKGSLVALCLDLFIRRQSRGKASLDDVMRLLWTRYGREFYQGAERGLPEDAFPDVVEEATGVDARREIRAWAYGTDKLPLDDLLADCGLRIEREPRTASASLGIRSAGDDRECRITHVSEGGPAHEAGLSAGDVLIAIDDLRVTGSRLEALLAKYRPGATAGVLAFRGDVLQSRRVTFGAAPLATTILDAKKAGKTAAAYARRVAQGLSAPPALARRLVGVVLVGGLRGDRVLLACPRAEVHVLAAFRTERPKAARAGPLHGTIAAGAGDDGHRDPLRQAERDGPRQRVKGCTGRVRMARPRRSASAACRRPAT